MYLALGIFFLVCAIGMGVVLILTALRSNKNRGELITKANLFYLAPAFLIAYGLALTASAFNGTTLDLFYCFTLISTTLDIFKFKLSAGLALPICQAYPIFYVDFILAVILGILTAILSVASFFSRRITNFVNARRLLRNKCDVVLGCSDDALQYVKNTPNSLILATNISAQTYADLLKRHVPVLRCDLTAKDLTFALRRDGYNVIVFRDGNHSYSKIFDVFTRLTTLSNINIHIEANQSEMKIIKSKFLTKADCNTKLFATGFSKYELLARQFVKDHPITKYIPRDFYNDNFTIINEKKIHVVFVGFGSVNYPLFRMCSMQFQFAQQIDDELKSKPVHYHVYDRKDPALHNEFFSRLMFEFDEDFADCDFPKPEKICEIETKRLDTNSVEAKQIFKSFVSKDSFTYFIVSMEDDLEDASYAQTIKRLLRDEQNYRIFVRAKNSNGEKLNDEYADDEKEQIIYFGDERKLLSHENIVNDDLTELAKRINLLYNKVDDKVKKDNSLETPKWVEELQSQKDLSAKQQNDILTKNLADPDSAAYMQAIWRELPNIEQDSNLYHALNLPFKLNLLGFDMVKRVDENDDGVSENDFNKVYKNSGRDNGYNDYTFFFNTESSNVLAYIEHSRWNALYILYDYEQMKKADLKIVEEIKNGEIKRSVKRKNIDLKQHACLTTYYGLDEVVNHQFKLLYPDEKYSKENYKYNRHLLDQASIYAYDYMDLDRLYSEIIAMGYKLIPNGNAKK